MCNAILKCPACTTLLEYVASKLVLAAPGSRLGALLQTVQKKRGPKPKTPQVADNLPKKRKKYKHSAKYLEKRGLKITLLKKNGKKVPYVRGVQPEFHQGLKTVTDLDRKLILQQYHEGWKEMTKTKFCNDFGYRMGQVRAIHAWEHPTLSARTTIADYK